MRQPDRTTCFVIGFVSGTLLVIFLRFTPWSFFGILITLQTFSLKKVHSRRGFALLTGIALGLLFTGFLGTYPTLQVWFGQIGVAYRKLLG